MKNDDHLKMKETTKQMRLSAAAPKMFILLKYFVQEFKQYDIANDPEGPTEKARLSLIERGEKLIKLIEGEKCKSLK